MSRFNHLTLLFRCVNNSGVTAFQYALKYSGDCIRFNLTFPGHNNITAFLTDSSIDDRIQTTNTSVVLDLQHAQRFVQIVSVHENGTICCDSSSRTDFYRFVNPEKNCMNESMNLVTNQLIMEKVTLPIPEEDPPGNGDIFLTWRRSPTEDQECFCRVHPGVFEDCVQGCRTEYNITMNSGSIIFRDLNFTSNRDDFVVHFIYKENPCRPLQYVCASFTIMGTYVLSYAPSYTYMYTPSKFYTQSSTPYNALVLFSVMSLGIV